VLPFYCIFTATAAAAQQTRHITAATISGVISKRIRGSLLSQLPISTEFDSQRLPLGLRARVKEPGGALRHTPRAALQTLERASVPDMGSQKGTFVALLGL